MTSHLDGSGRLPDAYMTPGSTSFVDFLSAQAPGLLPGNPHPSGSLRADEVAHATTIVAVTYRDGVVMAADRRATMGNVIAQRDIEKVFQADEFSCVGAAGTAGVGEELMRLFQMELEHYEKIAGHTLSLEGKANRLAAMVRGLLGMAMQGLAVVPLFAGYEDEHDTGRIFSYDVTGARYEEHQFYAIGSGSPYARGALKKLYREGFSEHDAVLATLQALYDAADDDSATGGPDMARRIYPMVAVVDADGFRRVPDDDLDQRVRTMIESRTSRPDGPVAPLE